MTGIGKNLRRRAKELKLSDAEVARRLDISARRYSYYVHDAREPDFQTLKKIAKVLKISLDDLFAD
ncbi:MAG: helix-turn-helix transcriptional regulator [Alphaproteobacteria bacterium]